MRSALALAFLLALSTPARADADAYTPSAFRVYAGPAMWISTESSDTYAIGGTLAFQWHFDARRIFFLGGRAALLEDPRGIGSGYFGGFLDAEIGARPRLVQGRNGAFALVGSGGVGAGFIKCSCSVGPTGFSHFALRLGPAFDVGPFTMDALAGPTVLWNGDGAAGAIEVVVDLGARF